jgi:hypothetical protein
MSGQLVGEVLDAAEVLQGRGLSERGFHALVAIAEKCHHVTRQGAVPWKHIRNGLYGASKRTAERAVQDLKAAGIVRVVKRGFNNNHGRICAPIYEIQPLTDTDTQAAQSPKTDTDTQVTQSVGTDTDKTGDRYRQNDDRYRHPGGVLNGSTNGSRDGGARASADAPQPPRCPKHINHTDPPPCRDCKRSREAAEAEQRAAADAEQQARAQVRARIDNCTICEGTGFVDVDDNTVKPCECRGAA